MAQFEAEVITSLNTIQARLAAVEQSANKASASVARISPAAQTATASTNNLASSVGRVGAAASAAGGPVAGMMTRLGGLAALNPIAIASGAAIGFITSKVMELVQALGAASVAQERLSSAFVGSPGVVGKSATNAIANADVNQLRYGVDTKTMEQNLADFRKRAPAAQLSAEQKLQVSLGMENVSPADFSTYMLRRRTSDEWARADVAASVQANIAGREMAATESGAAFLSGTMVGRERAAYVIENDPELKNAVKALAEEIRGLKGQRGGWQFGWSDDRLEERIREKEGEYNLIYDRASTVGKY